MADRHQYRKTISNKRPGKLAHLPNDYARTLQKRLLDKDKIFSVHTIRAVVQGVRTNTDILNEAILYAEECRKISKALK